MSDPNDDFIMPPDAPPNPPPAKPAPKPPTPPVILPPWAKRILAFDVETTGTDSDARIIEFGACLFVDGKEEAFWTCLVNPGNIDMEDPRVVEALGVNGVSPSELASAMPFSQALHLIQSAFGQAPVRVAHHSRFDTGMIRAEIERLKADPTVSIDDYAAQGPYRNGIVLDTLALDIVLNPLAKGRGLAPVAERWGVSGWQKHRARGDASAAGRILLAMAPKFAADADLNAIVPMMKESQARHDEHVAARKAEAAKEGGTK